MEWDDAIQVPVCDGNIKTVENNSDSGSTNRSKLMNANMASGKRMFFTSCSSIIDLL